MAQELTWFLDRVENMPLTRNDFIKLILANDLFWGLGTCRDRRAYGHLLGFHMPDGLSATGGMATIAR